MKRRSFYLSDFILGMISMGYGAYLLVMIGMAYLNLFLQEKMMIFLADQGEDEAVELMERTYWILKDLAGDVNLQTLYIIPVFILGGAAYLLKRRKLGGLLTALAAVGNLFWISLFATR